MCADLHHCSSTSLWIAVFQPLSVSRLSRFSFPAPFLKFKPLTIFQSCHYFFLSAVSIAFGRRLEENQCMRHGRADMQHCSKPLWRESPAQVENWTKLSLFLLFAKAMKIFGGGASTLQKEHFSAVCIVSGEKKDKNPTNPKPLLAASSV